MESTPKLEKKIKETVVNLKKSNEENCSFSTLKGKESFKLYQQVLIGEAQIPTSYNPVANEKAMIHGTQQFVNA